MATHKTAATTKERVALTPTGETTVLKTLPGSVSFLDKLKGYYHTLITLVSALVSLLAVVGGATKFIPGPVAGYVVIASTFLATILNFLKSNEHWVDSV